MNASSSNVKTTFINKEFLKLIFFQINQCGVLAADGGQAGMLQ